MFSFAYPYLLLLLVLIPVGVLLYLQARYVRSRSLKRFGKPEVLKDLMPEVSKYKPVIKITLEMTALALIILAICRPWGAMREQQDSHVGIEIAIAMDVSNSMLASSTDKDGDVSRLRASKMMLEKLLGKLDNDRVGLVVYAGEAYTLLPVTSDYVSAKTYLNSINTEMVPVQGTAIADAIQQCTDMFNNSKDAEKNKGIGKAIILITDAEDLEGDAVEAAEKASKNGIQVNVVGVGSTKGIRIPLDGGRYLSDENGDVVYTKLNEEMAVEIAKAGNGIYVNAANSEALPELLKQLNGVKKSAWSSSPYAAHDELFQLFVLLAIILLAIDVFMLDRKIKWLSKITFFRKEERK